MMGPGFGRDLENAITTFGVLVLVVGILTGIGCSAGCSYLKEHLGVTWSTR